MYTKPHKPNTSRETCKGDGKTYWLADTMCPVPDCGSNCRTNGRVTQCINDKCGWDDAGRTHGRE